MTAYLRFSSVANICLLLLKKINKFEIFNQLSIKIINNLMLFNSFTYIIFLSVVLSSYFLIPIRYRWLMLLVSSYIFYGYWNPAYCFVIFILTVIDYIVAQVIFSSTSRAIKSIYLSFCLLTNLGLLFFFKYLKYFLSLTFQSTTNQDYDILLPIGISFYTFQTLSYIFDVYRGEFIPEKHFGKFALYVSFFPKLIAGPIERAHNLLPQFSKNPIVTTSLFLNGIKRILWGLFKKMIIADKLALIIDPIYGQPYGQNGFLLLFATYLFAFQIYCDFSGYCDIAIGSGQLFGIKLSNNFQKPFFATSIADFWRRWHITLTSWFRDYVYISLGGNRTSTFKWYRNILIVFLISGLWHGAGWTFVLWGLIHGLFYLCGLLTKEPRKYFCNKIGLNKHEKVHRVVQIVITFNLVSFCWIFFRASDVNVLMHILRTIINDLLSINEFLIYHNYNLSSIFEGLNISRVEVILYLCLLGFFIFIEGFDWIERYCYPNDPNNIKIQELFLLNIITVLIILLGDISGKEFIYFQF